jgi:hypothetical protein
MRRCTARVAVLCALFVCTSGDFAAGGTIRHDRNDSLYTNLAASADFQAVGKFTIDGPITVASGTLIRPDWVLTAAHIVSFPTPANVTFELAGNQYEAAEWIVHPAWTGELARGADLALVRLQSPVMGITPATLFAGNLEVDKTAVFVGYGQTGTGLTGSIEGSEGTKRAGENVIEALGSAIGVSDNYVLADFDSPFGNTSVFGDRFPLNLEYFTARFDSGSGMFLDEAGAKHLAGVAAFGAYLDDVPNASYGEIDGFTRVSRFRDWITEQTSPNPGPPAWNKDAGGNWTVRDNWSRSVPNVIGARAIFGDAITAPRSVAVDRPITVGTIDFDNANTYTITGPNALTLDTATGDAQINVINGNHVVAATVRLDDNTVVTVTPAASTLSMTGTIAAGGLNLTKAGAGTLSVVRLRAAVLSVNAGKMVLAPDPGAPGPETPVFSGLTIAGGATPTARLDLTDRALVLDYSGASPAATIRSQLLAGRGSAGLGAAWTGPGITSSVAAAANAAEAESRSVGYAENSALPLGAYTSFHGQPVDDTSILMAFARTGDANLDGLVNDDDVTIVGATYAPGVAQPHWALGDFDYNGFVDDDDVTLLGAFYNPSAPPLAPAAPASTSGVAAVPEPGTVVLFLAGLIATLLAHSVRRESR